MPQSILIFHTEMAGNIIPAIATTNAIVSGLIVLQALHLLRKAYDKLKTVHILITGNAPLSSNSIFPPNPKCGICRDTYDTLLCDPSRTKLGDVVEKLLGDGEEGGGIGPRDVAVYEDKRLLLDPDFDDNTDRTLESLGVTRGKFLTIVDEDGEYGTISVAVGLLPYV
jgi:ubiquitin-like 1-activating enzyme E1 B